MDQLQHPPLVPGEPQHQQQRVLRDGGENGIPCRVVERVVQRFAHPQIEQTAMQLDDREVIADKCGIRGILIPRHVEYVWLQSLILERGFEEIVEVDRQQELPVQEAGQVGHEDMGVGWLAAMVQMVEEGVDDAEITVGNAQQQFEPVDPGLELHFPDLRGQLHRNLFVLIFDFPQNGVGDR